MNPEDTATPSFMDTDETDDKKDKEKDTTQKYVTDDGPDGWIWSFGSKIDVVSRLASDSTTTSIINQQKYI